MIVYGLTMQGKTEEIPKEVATWLFDRDSRYPNIEFIVDCWDPHSSQVEEFEATARKYSRLYHLKSPFSAGNILNVSTVTFPYLKQTWNVRIVGAFNEKENRVATQEERAGSEDGSREEYIRSLPLKLRAEIAGLSTTPTPSLPAEMERINRETAAVIRHKDETPLEKPTEMIPFSPDWRRTSEFSISGDETEKFVEYAKLLLDPAIQKEAESAIRAKDWEKLKQLKAQRYN